MGSKSNSYLPTNGAGEAARKKAAKAILAMSNKHFPEHRIDADEPFDTVETVGSPTAPHNLLVLDPDSCLGFTCPLKSDACDRCKLADK